MRTSSTTFGMPRINELHVVFPGSGFENVKERIVPKAEETKM